MNFGSLSIRTIAMHQVSRRADAAQGPILSDVATALDADQQAFLQLQFRKVLGTNARPITEDAGLSKTPDAVRAYLASQAALLETSQALAKELQALQPPVSPGGIFICAECEIEKVPSLLVAKLEHEYGVRAHPTQLANGQTTFTVEFLQDLLLTSGSKIFKVALFTAEAAAQPPLSGVLVDRQFAGSGVAQYFLTSFLGCKLTERADILTQSFHSASEAWINTIPDAEKKGRYQVALLSDLQSNRKTLSVDKFASEHLEVNDRDDYSAALTGAGVPRREFERDTTLIKSKIGRLRLDTKSGVMVLAPPETLEDGTVRLENHDDETTTISVRDHLQKVTGGRGAQGRTD